MRHLLLAALAAGTALALPAASGIEWSASHEDARAQAREEKRVLFLAVNMDGERANDELAEKTYREKRITELAAHSVNLVASAFEHGTGECKRFGTITCGDHVACDIWARENVLEKDAEGFVVAPQHVWLSPEGEVLLSVPYAVTEGELEWCFVTALTTNDPTLELKMSSKARAPRRLVKGGVADVEGGDQYGPSALTRDEVLALIEEVRRGVDRQQRVRAVMRIMTADEPEAVDFVRSEMRSGLGGGRGGGRGGARGRDPRPGYLRAMARLAPASYWVIAAEYVDDSLIEVRSEAVVALEMLASPDSLRDVSSALRKEKELSVKKNLLRALGTAGAADKKTIQTLVKTAEKDRDELLRRNALIALGSVVKADKVDDLLRETLLDEERDPRERAAAVCAMALTRRAEWLELLRPALEAAEARDAEATPEGEPEEFVPPDDLLLALRSAVALLEGGDLSVIKDAVTAAGRDEIPRERWFGVERAGQR